MKNTFIIISTETTEEQRNLACIGCHRGAESDAMFNELLVTCIIAHSTETRYATITYCVIALHGLFEIIGHSIR